MNSPPASPFARLRLALNWSGVIILLGGLGGSVLIWRAQDRIGRENEAAQIANPAAPLPPLDSGKHVRDVEIYYGKVGVLLEKADELFQGKTLANTIAVVSLVTAIGLFLVASRVPD